MLHILFSLLTMNPGRREYPQCCESSSNFSASCLVERYRERKGGCAFEDRYTIFLGELKLLRREARVSLLTCSYVPAPPAAVPLVTDESKSVPMVWTITSASLICGRNLAGLRISPTSHSTCAFSGYSYLSPFLDVQESTCSWRRRKLLVGPTARQSNFPRIRCLRGRGSSYPLNSFIMIKVDHPIGTIGDDFFERIKIEVNVNYQDRVYLFNFMLLNVMILQQKNQSCLPFPHISFPIPSHALFMYLFMFFLASMVCLLILFDYIQKHNQMHFQHKEIEISNSPQGKNRVLGVIVLTDNRQEPNTDKPHLNDFRCSAFRQTEADPLQFCQGQWGQPHEEGVLQRLAQRVTALEQRLLELSHLEATTAPNQRNDSRLLKKKHRRKFKQLVRDQQCPICQKIYGSQTSLKYHLKLKHAKHDENHSQSN